MLATSRQLLRNLHNPAASHFSYYRCRWKPGLGHLNAAYQGQADAVHLQPSAFYVPLRHGQGLVACMNMAIFEKRVQREKMILQPLVNTCASALLSEHLWL